MSGIRLNWRQRDARYARAKNQLTDSMIDAVRRWRIAEAGKDIVLEHEAATWQPPLKGDMGTL